MLKRIVYRTGFPVDQKFLSEEMSASRKPKGKSDFFPRADGLTFKIISNVNVTWKK